MRKPALTLKTTMLSTFAVMGLVCAIAPTPAFAEGETIRYMDKNGAWCEVPRDEAIDITHEEGSLVLKDGKTYIITEDCTLCQRLEVKGSATLVVFENVNADLLSGIRCGEGNSLTIAGQRDTLGGKPGSLKVRAMGEVQAAAIGGDDDEDAGEIAICFCDIDAYGADRAAAIGGGECGDGGKLIIREASVTANSDDCAAAIGGGSAGFFGDAGDGGEVLIVDSDVTAIAKDNQNDAGAGIGGGGDSFINVGDQGDGGDVTILGYSHVEAQGGDGAAIGRGDDEGKPGTVTLSDNLIVTDLSKNKGMVAPFAEREAYCLYRSHVLIEPGESRA